MNHHTLNTEANGPAAVREMRTPYHALGAGSPRVPEWAQHRTVYRTAGRTLYRVGTDRLDAARRDLSTLAARGWDVEIDRDGDAASITLSRTAA